MPKTVIRSVVVLFCLCCSVELYAQDSVYTFKEANIKLNMPNAHWRLRPKEEKNGFVIYVFKRDPIMDSSNRNIIPNAAVVIEKINPKMDVITYSMYKRTNAAFDVTKVFSHEDGTINYLNAVGYQGTYSDDMAHTVYVVHAKNGDKGIQIILDTTTETLAAMDPEFLQILKSFRK
jgi:hypothetical protein